ncbi:MAG: hypothetical protein OEZ10_10290 [Gammaproteobacteria bacterium]|nr:hypothetical protein [Gammaproteobacteria bacterium]
MATGVVAGKCPACEGGVTARKRREDWMRWIPASRVFECKSCGARYLIILNLLRFPLS